MGIGDEEQRGFAAAAANAARLGTAVEQKPEAFRGGILPLLRRHFGAGRREPRAILDAQLFVPCTRQKPALAQYRKSAPQVR